MKKKEPKIIQLNVKIEKKTAQKFKDKCKKEGLRYAWVAEKLLKEYCDGRR